MLKQGLSVESHLHKYYKVIPPQLTLLFEEDIYIHTKNKILSLLGIQKSPHRNFYVTQYGPLVVHKRPCRCSFYNYTLTLDLPVLEGRIILTDSLPKNPDNLSKKEDSALVSCAYG